MHPCRLMKEKEYQYKKLFSEQIFLIGPGTRMKSLLLPGGVKEGYDSDDPAWQRHFLRPGGPGREMLGKPACRPSQPNIYGSARYQKGFGYSDAPRRGRNLPSGSAGSGKTRETQMTPGLPQHHGTKTGRCAANQDKDEGRPSPRVPLEVRTPRRSAAAFHPHPSSRPLKFRRGLPQTNFAI